MENNIQREINELRKENEALRKELNNNISKEKRKQKSNQKKLAWTWRLFTGESLHKSFNNWFTEYHTKEKVSPDTSANLLTSLVKRFVRVRMLSVILLLFSLFPSLISLFILLKQNDLIDTQNSLVEASRKSSYGFQLSNIFESVDRRNGVIDKNLRGRIIGLSHSLKPYRILEANGKLSESLYSPERTQLLLFLLNAGVDNSTLSKIYDAADFSNCDLRNTNLSRKFLTGINLQYSNLENAELHSSNLNEANLTKANLKNIQFSNGTAKSTIFTDANLTKAKIKRVDLSGSSIKSAESTKNAIIEPLKN